MEIKLITTELLDDLSLQASENARLRMNYNFHESLNDNVQKLLNAMEPGTQLPIHRHRHTAETYIVLRGSVNLHIYNCRAELDKTLEINPAKAVCGVDIPAGQWHTIEVLEPETVIFEIKEGPYSPLTAEDILEK